MIDWQMVVLQIKRAFHLTDAELARLAKGTEEQISGLKRGLVREPRYTLAAELLKLKGKADGTGKTADKLGSVSEGQG